MPDIDLQQPSIKTDELSAFGRLLKFWRQVHKISQEELAFRIDSASRHISRLEKGGAHPTKVMVEAIAKALSLKRSDIINLLFSAGYISESEELNINAPKYSSRKKTMLRNLKALDPYPSLVIDLTGNLLMVNKSWVGFERELNANKTKELTGNFIEFLFDYADGQANREELEGNLSTMLLAVQQNVFFCGDKKFTAFLESLLLSPSIPANWQQLAAKRDAGGPFNFNAIINGKEEAFFTHSQTANLLGPLTFTSKPDMIVITFYPEQEDLNLSFLSNHDNKHPLLFY